MSQNIQKQMEEQEVREIMERLSLTESQAREWRAAFYRQQFANRTKIYDFLKTHNPKVAELEESGDYSKRIQQVAADMQIPHATATAVVISGEILAQGGLALLRKHRRLRRKKSTPEDIQEMLGVNVPIPQDIWEALGMDQ